VNAYARLFAATGLLTAFCASVSAETEGPSVSPLPEQSLAQWYKPANKRQVWLHTMFSLRRELQAVEEYAEAEDQPRLAKWAERLASNYRKIPEMVPEWADEVETELAAELERAAASGDFAGARSATRRLGRTCNGCHREFRALAAARFRTPDFGSVAVTLPDGQSGSHSDYMETLSTTLNRIKIAAEDQRWEASADAEKVLRAQLETLGETCATCHSDSEPKERILGQSSWKTLDELRTAINGHNEKDTGLHLGEAAVGICARCHGVHRTLYDLRSQLYPDS